MKFTIAAILALGGTTVHSFSYLESLGNAPPAVSAPAPAVEPPFFFTNGAKEVPDETPDFFFTDGPTGFAPAPAAASSSGYLDVIGSGTSSVSGPGMASYLDALPEAASMPGGPGSASYTAPQQAVAELTAPTIPSPVDAYVPIEPAGPVVAGANYLDNIGASSTAGAPSGAGLVGYLDALPAPAAAWGGQGIQSYTDGLPMANTVTGTDDSMSSTTPGRFDFLINANPELLEQIEASNGRPIRLSGKASFN